MTPAELMVAEHVQGPLRSVLLYLQGIAARAKDEGETSAAPYMIQMVEDSAEQQRVLREALQRARGCMKGLLARTPVRDVTETLAEIDAALDRAEGKA